MWDNFVIGFEGKCISKLQCNFDIIKSRSKYKDIESWHSDLRKQTKLRTYVTFKNEYNVEPYLLNPIQKWQCTFFAKLRCGIYLYISKQVDTLTLH